MKDTDKKYTDKADSLKNEPCSQQNIDETKNSSNNGKKSVNEETENTSKKQEQKKIEKNNNKNNGNLDQDNKNHSEEERISKYKTNLIIALISLITLNILLAFGAIMYYQHKANIYFEQASQEFYDNLNELLTDEVKQRLTDEVLQDHIREYYLPDDYFAIGLYVRKEARPSVVEILSGGNQTNPNIRATGIILDSEGHILTNAHAVTFSTDHVGGDINNPTHSRVYTVYAYINVAVYNQVDLIVAEVIDYDVESDLALLKLQTVPEELQNATFTSSDYASIGEECVVMGNTLGMGVTVSVGTVLGNYSYEDIDMIQLDALSLEGNSGAGVFNPLCEVIGMVSFKLTDDSGTESICYAVSSGKIIDYIGEVNEKLDLNISYTLSENMPDIQ